MKYIPLTQNKYTIVDDEDYPELSKYTWCADKRRTGDSYAVRTSPQIKGKCHKIYMHRQILGLKPGDEQVVDHIHHNTLDNRRKSLRKCTRKENNKNQKSKEEKAMRLPS